VWARVRRAAFFPRPAIVLPDDGGRILRGVCVMAIAFLRAVYHSRKAGHSAVRGAAYRSGQRHVNERTGEVCDWTHRKDDVLFEKIFTRDHAPADLRNDRAALWNAVEAAEVRGDARLAYEIKVALPHELRLEEGIELASAYAAFLRDRYGQAVDLTIHKPDEHGDTRNRHAHLMITPRALEADGFAKKKIREITDKVKGPQEIEAWRQGWQDFANWALERAGHAARIDVRSYKRQGLEREGEIHLGPAASAMERRGIQTDKGDLNRGIKQRNEDREQAKIIDLQIEREKRQQEQKRREELAAKYDQMIAREKRELQAAHQQDIEYLQREQDRRRQQDERRHSARFRTGFLGWWDKLTGRHAETERRNEQAREAQRRRDEADRQRLMEHQAQQRRGQEARHAQYERDKREILEHGETRAVREAFEREARQRQRDGPEQGQQRQQGMGRGRSLGFER
jgi:hypothetical protein